MRCPKCNYISFDEMEICGGCKKNISKFSQVLHGVIFKAEFPDFLWFQKPEEEPDEETEVLEEDENEIAESEPEEEDSEFDMGLDDNETESPEIDNTLEFATDTEESGVELDLDAPSDEEEKSQEIEFDLDLGIGADKEQKEEAEEIEFDLSNDNKSSLFDLDDNKKKEKGLPDLSIDGLDDLDIPSEDTAPSVKLDKAPAKKPSKKDQAAPDLSLGGLDDLDLSDLMPSSSDEKEDISLDDIGELSLESSSNTATSQKDTKKDSGLDLLSDLSIDGLDLDAPILPPASSAAGKKMRPAAKTGTALDSFDIDLGDLLGGNEKK